MNRTLFEKVKCVIERFIFHGKKFFEDTEELLKHRVITAEEAKNLLMSKASVKNLYDIEEAINGCYFSDGKINSYMSNTEYTLYDEYGFKLYFFNGIKADFINDKELLKVSKIINAVNAIKNVASVVFAIKTNGKYQYFFKVHEGKNGSGDFVDDDLKNVVKYLDAMKEAGAEWRCVTDVSIDIPDDVSTWIITFTAN